MPRAALEAAASDIELSLENTGLGALPATVLSSGSGRGGRSGSALSGTYPSAPFALRIFT